MKERLRNTYQVNIFSASNPVEWYDCKVTTVGKSGVSVSILGQALGRVLSFHRSIKEMEKYTPKRRTNGEESGDKAPSLDRLPANDSDDHDWYV